jgi:hypothetical protein
MNGRKSLVYSSKNATAKQGVNFVRSIIEKHNCIFHEINQSNDLGIDANIEFVIEEKPIPKLIATQIKSGKSFFNTKTSMCKIPIGSHFDYWLKHSLPVYGIVYIPELDKAYWVDIKRYLEQNKNATTISFIASIANEISDSNFLTIFVPRLLGYTPNIDKQLACKMFSSSIVDEFSLGLQVLFKKYVNDNETWKLFIEYFKSADIDNIPNGLVYVLAHIPWHPDIFHTGEMITEETRKNANELFATFDESHIVKLLKIIDGNRIKRGVIGQSVEAIVSSLPNFEKHLNKIILDRTYEGIIRELAVTIYAFNLQKRSLPLLGTVKNELDVARLASELIGQYGRIELY